MATAFAPPEPASAAAGPGLPPRPHALVCAAAPANPAALPPGAGRGPPAPPGPGRRAGLARLNTKQLVPQRTVRGFRTFVRKPRNLVAASIFVVMVGRAIFHYQREQQLIDELLSGFAKGRDRRLNTAEMVKLLGANGVELTVEQVGQLFGKVDERGDGYDQEELSEVVDIVADMPSVSKRLRDISSSGHIEMWDLTFYVMSGAGIIYLVTMQEEMERKCAARAFSNALHLRRLRGRKDGMEGQVGEMSEDRARLEADIKRIEQASHSALEERAAQLESLQVRLAHSEAQEQQARTRFEQEICQWRAKASKAAQDAKLAKQKLERVSRCVKGLDSFRGAGAGSYAGIGAEPGFAQVNPGFSSDSITFGTIEDGRIHLFETTRSDKIGDDQAAARMCTDMSSGRELTLKMYTIGNAAQRDAVIRSLHAHSSQIGEHAGIASFERVIESEDTIFLLMEPVDGPDLFEAAAAQGMGEAEVRPLFMELVQALQHMHGIGILHCDVRPQNAVVCSSPLGRRRVKLVDFGCSCFAEKEEEERLEAAPPSQNMRSILYDAYMPPEATGRTDALPTVAMDMWRLGCTLHAVLARRPSVEEEERQTRLRGSFLRGQGFEELSDAAQDLLWRLLAADPAARPTTAEVLRHQWFSQEAT